MGYIEKRKEHEYASSWYVHRGLGRGVSGKVSRGTIAVGEDERDLDDVVDKDEDASCWYVHRGLGRGESGKYSRGTVALGEDERDLDDVVEKDEDSLFCFLPLSRSAFSKLTSLS